MHLWLTKRWDMNRKLFCKREGKQPNTGCSREPTPTDQSLKATETAQDNILCFVRFVCFGKPPGYCYFCTHAICLRKEHFLFSWPIASFQGLWCDKAGHNIQKQVGDRDVWHSSHRAEAARTLCFKLVAALTPAACSVHEDKEFESRAVWNKNGVFSASWKITLLAKF